MAPASDAPIKVVKVYRQLCNSLTFNRPVLAPLGRTGGGNDKRGDQHCKRLFKKCGKEKFWAATYTKGTQKLKHKTWMPSTNLVPPAPLSPAPPPNLCVCGCRTTVLGAVPGPPPCLRQGLLFITAYTRLAGL